MRYTKAISVWPVGFVGSLLYEGPVVKEGVVVGWRTVFHRKYPVDMAAFAISIERIFMFPSAKFRDNVRTSNKRLFSLGVRVYFI